MKKLILIIALLSFTTKTNAQESLVNKTIVFKFKPLAAFFGMYKGGVETFSNNKTRSLVVNVSRNYKKKECCNNHFLFIIPLPSDKGYYELSGGSVEVEERFYKNIVKNDNDLNLAMYVATGFKFDKNTTTVVVHKSDSQSYSEKSISYIGYKVSSNFGLQLSLSEKYYCEFFVGAGFRVMNIDNKNGPFEKENDIYYKYDYRIENSLFTKNGILPNGDLTFGIKL
jgi:hypothetical protein